jgi:Mg-chelatase subunit ChlD
MMPSKKFQSRRRRGAIFLLVVMLMFVFLMMAAFTIDVGYMQLTKTQLRTAADAASRAAAGALSRGEDEAGAIAAAQAVAGLNDVAGQPLQLKASELTFGSTDFSQSGQAQFVPGQQPYNAVRVDANRRSDSVSGPVGLFFGRAFGMNQFEPEQTATAARLDRDIAVVIDRSGSMDSNGRWSALRNAVQAFLDELDDTPQIEQVSLISYADAATLDHALTSNMTAIRSAFDTLSPDGYTAIGNGLLTGSDSLEDPSFARPHAAKTIIVMTDGNHNTGPGPDVTVLTAASRHQTVHTITFGDGADQVLMADVALQGGGIHLHAPDNVALKDAFREIAAKLPVLYID